MALNSMLLKAKMLLSDATILLTQGATGEVTIKVGAIAESQVTGLTTKLTEMQGKIDALESGTIDLSAYTTEGAVSMTAGTTFTIAATNAVAVTGSAFTFGGKNVVTEDKLSVYELKAQKNVANGYAGLDASKLLDGTQLPIDATTLELKGGKLAVKTLPRVDNHVATGAVEGVPTIDGGATPEVGDIVAFKNDATSNAGEIYYRHSASTGKLADDYTLMNFQFVANLDNITQGTTNKYLNAGQLQMIEKLAIDENGDGLKVDGILLVREDALDNNVFTKTGTQWGLTDGGVAFAKMVQTGAVPSGWTVAASQVTGLDAELDSVVKTVAVTGPDALTATVEGTELTLELKLTGDITSSEAGLAINAGTGAGQFLKFTSANTLPALSGANLTALNASNLATGTVPAARLPIAGATAATKGAVYTEAGSGITIAADGKASVDTAVIATKASVDTVAGRVTKLEQAAVPFTSTDLADGILTVEAKLIPKGICKSDYTSLLPVFPETMTAPADDTGLSSFTLDLNGLSLVGDWLVVF